MRPCSSVDVLITLVARQTRFAVVTSERRGKRHNAMAPVRLSTLGTRCGARFPRRPEAHWEAHWEAHREAHWEAHLGGQPLNA